MRRRPLLTVATVIATLGAGLTALTGATAGPAGAATSGGFDFTRPETVASNLAVPWGIAVLPDGSALVAERDSARLLRVRVGQSPQVVGTVPNVVPGGEGGLLGLAVSPTYAADQWVYAYFTAANDNRIVRFRLDSLATQQVVLSGLAKAQFHNGGRIAFGPDGMLYAGVGDATTTSNAQNTSSLNGKILRMTPTGGVPSGNPFNNLVYSYGHRNVQGLAWDSAGRLWATEFGQNTWDEVNLIVAGGNYGWPTVEGRAGDSRFRDPLVQWATSQASPSGAAIANSTLFAAALAGTRLWTVPLNGTSVGTPVAELQGQYGRLRTVLVGPDGYLWVSTSNRDGRGTPASTDDRILRFPPVGGGTTTTSTSTTTSTTPITTTSTTTPSTTTTTTTSRTTTTTTSRTTTTTTTTGSSGACTATFAAPNPWPGGFVGTVTVTANTALTGWRVTANLPNGAVISNSWNATRTGTSGTVTFTNVSYNGSLGAGQSTQFGFQSSGSPTGTTVSCSAN